MVRPRRSVTVTFDRLTLKLVCKSHLRWGTFIKNLGTLGLWVLKLVAMYAMGGQKQRLLHLSLWSGYDNCQKYV